MNFGSILVVTDLSVQEGIAVQRAAQLAHRHAADLKLVYLPAQATKGPGPTPGWLSKAAGRLQDSLGLATGLAPLKADRLEDLAEHAAAADLVVLPHRRDRSTAAFFRGQPVSRLLRASGRPVLVARQAPAGHYRRILVAVDLSPASERLFQLAAKLDDQAELEIFHAISTRNEARLRSAEATERAIRAYRERCVRYAQQRLLALTDSMDARRNRLMTTLGRGDPGRQAVIQQSHSGADLVVVGKPQVSAWEDFLCGSVAHRILSWGTSDVLVVPRPMLDATAPLAVQRLRPHAPGERHAGASWPVPASKGV